MKTETKVELLAPAGNYQALLGALNAGADAVYLGGDKFGARAYADNFSQEEICKALRYAHFLGKRIYLTVNTLVKEEEFSQLYEYLAPLYETGLDGVIIQDLGVWEYVRKTFPDMPLHASTQMTITGEMGASFLKEMGAQCIVPARELSLEEIRQMKERTGLELECFIHGAMCYCYSGQCLFSSILGGRSGNRGRCAQPCRLPYQVIESKKTASKKEAASGELYPLSLKDMCTIEYIPRLIEAGIDSFKIEGRMKKPEYAAGVTAIYRKYIDAYYKNGKEKYFVSKEDMDMLRNLYIRSEIQTGYYERTNGREMITLHKPSYLGSDDVLLQEIAEKYLREEKKMSVTMRGIFHVGKPAMLQIEGSDIVQTFYGGIVQQATGKPMDKENLIKRLSKTGNSNVTVGTFDIEMDEAIFMPVGQLNELRRNAVEAFENKIIEALGIVPERKIPKTEVEKLAALEKTETMGAVLVNKQTQLHVSVQTLEQLKAVLNSVDRIYLDSDFYLHERAQIDALLQWTSSEMATENTQFYLALPYVVRAKDVPYLQELTKNMHEKIRGFLVRNLESAYFVQKLSKKYDIVTDVGVYQFNEQTTSFWKKYSKEGYLPYELNGKEYRRLIETTDRELSMVVFGTIPMMITANCLKKTTNSCISNGQSNSPDNWMFLQDRYKTMFPVMCNCKHCYNIIYNSLPFSLHKQSEKLNKAGLFAIRLDFVQESGDIVQKIIGYYQQKETEFPIAEYTTGHYKRGVE